MRRVHRWSVITAAALLLATSTPALGQTGPIAAYGFNEGLGLTTADATGNGGTATLTGATWTTAGKYGRALSFNGVSNWVTVNDAARLRLTTGMTLEAWVRATTLSDWSTVVLKERPGGLSYALYASDNGGRPGAWVRTSADREATASVAMATNTWVHVAATYDGATLRLYLDGVQRASRAVTGSIISSTSPLRIGGNSVWGEYFSGLIDEVRVYNRALTAAEIQVDMNTPVGGSAPPTWGITGSVTPAALGSGTVLTLTGPASAAATADAGGNYSFGGIANGVYTVTPSKSGVSFTPASRSVTVAGANVSGANFTAAPAPTSGIQLLQRAANGSEPWVTSMSAAFPSSNTPGSFLIVTGTAARPAGTITISDTAGNTYVPALGPITDGPQDVTAYIWYVPASVGGPNTVTLTPASARAMEIHISEWLGVSATAPLDQTAFASGFGTSATSGARTTSVAGELVFGYTFIAHTATAGAGFTPLTLVNGDLDEYQVQTTAGSVAATFTQATAGDWFVLMATFRPAPPLDTSAPSVSISAPSGGASLFGTTTVTANASDDVGVAGVQFRLDGQPLGSEVVQAPYSLSWNTALVSDGSHTLTAVARDGVGNSTTSAPVMVTVSNTSQPSVAGQWGAPFDLGVVAVDMILMHTGRVLMFSGTFATSAEERVWDPATGLVRIVTNPYYNLFCAGHAQLPDGRILLVGGFDPPNLGAANANIFDPVTESWSALPNMAYRRWYPTATTLPDGRMLVSSGAQSCLTCLADVPEIFDPATNRFSTMPTARLGFPYYPFMYVLPDGSVVNAGANEAPAATRKLDLATQTWTMVDPNVVDGHSSVMYRPGMILKSGTATDSGATGSAAATAYVIDMNQPLPAWRAIAPMAFPRAYHNLTLLPDGNVLLTGGGTARDGYNVNAAVRASEIWSPASETWRTVASAGLPRLYHATALLLPDGRILMAGSGNDGPAVNQTQGELYSPPYLFKGPRPTISSAPDLIEYGSAFTVQTPDAASIASVALIRPGSVTHSFDADQRFMNLAFQAGGGALTVEAPANANLAPPGYYMLFIVNNNGVPSVAPFVRFPVPSDDTQPPTAPGALVAQGGLGGVSLTWNAATDNTGVALYNVHRSSSPGFPVSAATRIGQATATLFNNSGLPAGTYYYAVTAQDVAGNISVASAEAVAIVVSDTTPPSVQITAPPDQTTVAGTITLSAAAADDVAVAGVQFRLDGAILGVERVAEPYSIEWNTAATSDGPHTLTAVARDAAGNSTASTVTVTVTNGATTPSGLVAAFGFNEGSGVQSADGSGQGNTATIAGPTWTAAGRYGRALSFSGTSGWVTVSDAASLDLTTGMTIEAWIRPTSNSGWRTVVLKENVNAMSYGLYSVNGASRPAGWFQNGSDFFVNGTAAPVLNVWTHLAVTHDGTTLRMYVNGALVGSRAAAAPLQAGGGALRIGGNAVWGEYFRGQIDEVRIYNRPLTPVEVQADMNTPIP